MLVLQGCCMVAVVAFGENNVWNKRRLLDGLKASRLMSFCLSKTTVRNDLSHKFQLILPASLSFIVF